MRRRLAVPALSLLSSCLAALCKPWCVEHCGQLNGDVESECGGCPADGIYRCFAGASSFGKDAISVPVDSDGTVVVSDPEQANGTSLADPVSWAHKRGPDDDLLHPQARLLPLVWRTSVCAHGVPPWLVEELGDDSDRPDHLIESVEQAERRCATGVVSTAPEMPGASTGDSVPIPRVPEDEMSPSDFFHRHLRTGLPLVLAGTARNGTRSREQLRLDIRAARAARLTDRTQSKESYAYTYMLACLVTHLRTDLLTCSLAHIHAYMHTCIQADGLQRGRL